MRTAILVDGGFFLHRFHALRGPVSPEDAANALHDICRAHLKRQKRSTSQLYRIFYYDCPPLLKKAHNPVTKKAIDYAKSPTALWRIAFFEQLKKKRKVALRLGHLADGTGGWALNASALKDLLSKKRSVDDLTEADVRYEVRQKGVDMRIGIDIASMAYKKQVDQIVLIAGDSDFVPAAKLARREGIDFILDAMWASIADDLHEHIDGLSTVYQKPKASPPVLPAPAP
jgi:uncharacterized LabA/DUF88 family protein